MSARVLLPTRAEAGAALLSAALFAVAFPPFPPVVPALLCVAPLAVAVVSGVDQGRSIRSGARLGFWFAVLGYGANIYWIATALSLFTRLAVLAYIGAVIVLGVVLAAVIAALFAARRATGWPMAILLPIVWVAGEFVLAHLPGLAFPWLPLGLGAARTPVLAQLAELSGVHGVSFWMAAVNGFVADAWIAQRRRSGTLIVAGFPRATTRRTVITSASLAVAVTIAAGAFGWWRMSVLEPAPLMDVAIVQPAVAESEKWDDANQQLVVGRLAGLTRTALKADPALVVWPETALPDFLFRHPAWRDTLRALTAPTATPLLTGVLDVDFRPPLQPVYYNGALLVDLDGIVRQPVYRKQYLVPVVERVPFINPMLVRGWSEYLGGYGRGNEAVVLRVPGAALGVLICYETAFGDLARSYIRMGATLLVSITNDAWFGNTFAPYQHFAQLTLRAIETRTGVVQAANSGISGYVDPLGVVRGTTDLETVTVAQYEAESLDVTTLYVKLGDWVGTLSLLGACSLIASDALRLRAARRLATA